MRINVNAFMKLLGQKIKIHLPEILTGAGIVAFSGAVATAIIRTPKANEQFKEHKKRLEELPMTPQEEKREKMLMVGDLAKAYWPTALCMTAGISAVVCADGIHMKREAILAGQLGTAVATLKGVADRIEEKYGKEEADKLFYGTKEIEEKETKTNKKTGKTTEVTKIKEVIDRENAEKALWVCLDENHPFWPQQDSYSAEETFLHCRMMKTNLQEIEKYLTQKLQTAEGHVFVNDTLKMIQCKYAANAEWIGWFYNVKDANPKYHNVISFHLDDPVNDRFNAGLERCVWVKLTPDGNIFQELKGANLIEALFERG